MKIKPKRLPKVPTHCQVDLVKGKAKVTHAQTVRQSLNYQSIEAHYGVTLECAADADSIEECISEAEKIVEDRLVAKFKEQGTILNQLVKNATA